MKKQFLKYFSTKYRRNNIYGDMILEEWGTSQKLHKRVLMVKLFGILWVTYKTIKF